MKLRAVDKLFSTYIRTRDSWTCQRCGKQYTPPTQALHCSHFFGRRKESVRFDPDNCDCHCWGCHSYFEQHPEEHRQWKLKRLGQKRFDALIIRANTAKKKDDKLTAIMLKEMIKNL
jgi:hypothetical protein